MTKMQAIKASIEHWQDNVEKAMENEQIDIRQTSCALCDRYYHYGYCGGCPVKFHSEHDDCYETPYHEVVDRVDKDGSVAQEYTWKELAKACWLEYLFLLNIWYAEGGGAL